MCRPLQFLQALFMLEMGSRVWITVYHQIDDPAQKQNEVMIPVGK